MTEQELALKSAKKQFGTTAFTEHHVNYRRVGFKSGGKVISAVADTWDDAIQDLLFKALFEVNVVLDKILKG